MNYRLVCKNCGNKEDAKNLQSCEEFTITQEADKLQPTVCTCNKCGNNGILTNFTKLASQSVGGKTQDASDISEPVSTTETRNTEKKYRKTPEKRIKHNDPEQVRGTVAMSNPFVKKAEPENNPFVKVAREFKRSPWGQYMKNLSEENMSFPENPPVTGKNSTKSDSSKKTKGQENAGPFDSVGGTKGGNESDNKFSTFDFNPIDRKEYRSSPKRRDLEPGAAAWEDKEVDKYYDGWVSDHVRNSGGKVIGSNTPKENIMNLDDDEREKDLGNRDMIYERLLEARHNFNDDYSFVEVADQNYKISKEAAKRILASRSIDEENTFISKAALEVLRKKADKDCGCGCGEDTNKEASSKKKTLNKKASKYPLLSIPI